MLPRMSRMSASRAALTVIRLDVKKDPVINNRLYRVLTGHSQVKRVAVKLVRAGRIDTAPDNGNKCGTKDILHEAIR